MPRIPGNDEMSDIIKPGEYLVKIIESSDTKDGELRKDKNGNALWNIKLTVMTEGEFYTEKLFDNIIFSKNLERRTKGIFNALGFDTSKGLDANNSQMVLDRMVRVTVINEEYNDEMKGKIQFFGGYHSIDNNVKEVVENENVTGNDDDIPF